MSELKLTAGEQRELRKRKLRRYARDRRELLAVRGLCINGALHGVATHGKLCARCRTTHTGRRQAATQRDFAEGAP